MDDNDLDVDRCFDKWVLVYWGLLERNHMMSFHKKHPPQDRGRGLNSWPQTRVFTPLDPESFKIGS